MDKQPAKKLILSTVLLVCSLFLLIIGLILLAIVFTFPRLPTLERITHYEPSMPIKIYSQDNVLIGQYGVERREFTKIDDFPEILKYAVLAAEDKHFYKHKGFDVAGISRAFISNFLTGHVSQGASTITQQVAKNFFLSNEKTYKRKFYEILLALKIEMNLRKDQILELYFNQIYLGQKAYGFTAASEAYFGKPVKYLTVAEVAMLAGLPKAPSAFNPIVNPERARKRQLYVLQNMLSEGWITQKMYKDAINQKLAFKNNSEQEEVDENSLYVAEMVRKQLHDRYGDDIYRSGFRVYATVTSKNQKTATQAVRRLLLRQSPKTKFRGSEAWVDLSKIKPENLEVAALHYLSSRHTVQGEIPAIVIEASPQKVKLLVEKQKSPINLTGAALNPIKHAINNTSMGKKQVQVGSIIRLAHNSEGGWQVIQPPLLEAGLIAIEPRTVAIQAVVGGFDFFSKQFNRATQAYRQPGSTFKPFVYSAAIEKGYSTATVINDAPVHYGRYSPKNASGGYHGPTTLASGFAHSRNVVAVRLLYSIGLSYAYNYLSRFGLKKEHIPQNLTMVLGSGDITPLQMARGYAVFANGGFLVSPYVIDRIYNARGQLIAQTKPLIAGKNAPHTISTGNAYIMYKMLQSVIREGTGRAALAMNRSDIGGKTGTSNKRKDAWFVGFNQRLAAAVYVGYDNPAGKSPVGYGAQIALPLWMEYMRQALKNIPDRGPTQPKDVIEHNGFYSLKGKSGPRNLPISTDNNAESIGNHSDTAPSSESTNLDNLF